LRLTKFQKQLCNLLQKPLPICAQPFAEIAKSLNSSEKKVLQQTKQLKKLGVIRRIGAVVNHRALGMTGTLVAAHIPEGYLQEIAEAVNAMENVSHNYLRKHYYNLWFTLQAQSPEEIKVTLSKLSARFDIDFHSLPVKRIFKLDVRFDAESEGQLLRGVEQALEEVKSKKGKIELSGNEKLILTKLQNDLHLTARPFDFLCGNGLGIEDVLGIIQKLIDKSVIRRIAAVVDHRKLGFIANVLFVGKVPQDRIVEAGKALARFRAVTHCYERKTFEGWPYNLFAMMHGKSFGDIQRVIDKFVETEDIDSYELLPTAAELKKQSITHHL